MNSRRFWLRVLNVYPDEWWIVKRLYLLQFFQGAGISFLFTSSFAQFVEKFPITDLPWVMVWSAILLWVAGFVYTKLEHKVPLAKFNIGLLVFMTVSMFVLWMLNYMVEGSWFFYLLMSWFNVSYMLNNMQFWGIAALLFDLRQSKRHFAVISAGDTPAKFIGYTLALIFVPYTGSKDLLLIGAICMVGSIPFFVSIVRSGKLDKFHHHEKHRVVNPAPAKIGKLVSNIVTNDYIRRIAFISLITSTCVILMNYGFYGEVKKAYHDDVELASFIAFFYASLRVIAFITKMVFSGRLTASIGVRSAMFITPAGMMIMIGVIAVVSRFSQEQMLIFYLFGIGSMLVDVLRSSFNSPVLLTLMQPLATHERLRAHNIVKGIMDPFASLLSGVLLLSLFHIHQRVDLKFLCYVLSGLGVLWLAGVALVNRQYIGILMKTIGSRYFSRDEFNLRDEAIMEQVRNKMMTGTELEVISIMTMLNSQKMYAVAQELIVQLLQHPSDKVRIEALRVIHNRNFTHAREAIESLLRKETDRKVRNKAIEIFCKIGEENWDIQRYLDSPDEDVKSAAITGMLANANGEIKQKAEVAISALLHSTHKKDRLKAISVLDGVKDYYDHKDHSILIDDDDPEIQSLAINAVGKAASAETLNSLLPWIRQKERAVLDALYQAGHASIPVLKKWFSKDTLPDYVKEKLILVCGKIGGNKAKQFLIDLLTGDETNIPAIVRALYRCRYAVTAETEKKFESIARSYIIYGVELLYMQRALNQDDARDHILYSSLEYEINNIREMLLCVFGCMYDRDKMNQVKYGLSANREESIANAMEIIELTVKKDLGRQFNSMFETTSVEQRCEALRSLFTHKQFDEVEMILGRILSEQPIEYYNWTKAYSLYVSKKYLNTIQADLFNKYTSSDNRLLKETALFVTTP